MSTARRLIVLLLCIQILPAQAFDLQIEVGRCAGCHGTQGRAELMRSYGRIAGQNELYLNYILKQYRANQLSGIDAAIMTYAMKHLSDDNIRALAHYYAQLP